MDLDVDGPPIGAEYATAIKSGLSTMGVEDIEVLYTDDFVSTIQTLTGNSSYGAERGDSGIVAAKTLRLSTGVVAIVANRTILEEYGPEATERVLAHEAGHVHTMNRAEDLGWHDTLELETDYWARMVLAMGMHAADEFRCEAAVYQAGYGSEYGSTDAGVAQSLYEYTARSLEPLYEPDLAPDDIRRQHIVQ